MNNNTRNNSFVVQGTAAEQLAVDVSNIFIAEGYSLEAGDIMQGQYGKGKKWLKLLIGGFANRFVFEASILQHKNGAQFTLSKHAISSMSGGLLGARKYTNEYERLLEVFESKLG